MAKQSADPAKDDGYIPDSAYDDMDEEALEAERVEIPVPDDYYDDLEPDQLDYDSEWQDGLVDPPADMTRSVGERGCIVGWYCRQHPAPNELSGCEEACVWTRETGESRPHCFGMFGGQGLVGPGELLFEVVAATCRACLHQTACAAEYEQRHPTSEAALRG